MVPDWWLDEAAHAGVEHLDPAYVATYDAKAATDWSEEVEELLAEGIGPASTVVDLGAGTGTFALAIKPHVARVVAVDVSPAMIATLRARGLEAVQAGLLSYEHEGSPPDAILSRNALHHLPDFWKAIALARVSEMLTPDGLFVLDDIVYDFAPRDAERAVDAWLGAAPADPSRGWTRSQLVEHVQDEHSTYTWLLEPMLERAGFEIRSRWTSESGIYASYRCVRCSPG